MEYVWRTTQEELTVSPILDATSSTNLTFIQLLDDDSEVIGRYFQHCASDDLLPAYEAGEGNDYFELDTSRISEDEIPELFGTSSAITFSPTRSNVMGAFSGLPADAYAARANVFPYKNHL